MKTSNKPLVANIGIIVSLLLTMGVVFLLHTLDFKFGPNASMASSAITASIFLIVISGYCFFTKQNFVEALNIKKLSIIQIIFCMIVGFGILIGAGSINNLSSLIFPTTIQNDSAHLLKFIGSSSFVVGFISISIMPGIFEELFFRGMLTNAYKGYGKVVSCVLTTVIFATYHQNLMQLIYVMFFGVVLFLVREYTDSTVGSIISHATSNGISYLAYTLVSTVLGHEAMLEQTKRVSVSGVATIYASVVGLSISIGIIGAGLYFLKSYKDKKKKATSLATKSSFVEENDFVIEKSNENSLVAFIPLVIYFIYIVYVITFK